MTAPAALQHALDPDALRRARRCARLTLDDAAAHVGRSASVLARYERGEIDPPASVLAGLARLYRVPPGTFFAPA